MIRQTMHGLALSPFFAALALAGCTGVSEAGRPQVEIAPGYVATICETSVGLTGHKRGGGVMFTAKWGCAE